jgi:hypothetical protein
MVKEARENDGDAEILVNHIKNTFDIIKLKYEHGSYVDDAGDWKIYIYDDPTLPLNIIKVKISKFWIDVFKIGILFEVIIEGYGSKYLKVSSVMKRELFHFFKEKYDEYLIHKEEIDTVLKHEKEKAIKIASMKMIDIDPYMEEDWTKD